MSQLSYYVSKILTDHDSTAIKERAHVLSKIDRIGGLIGELTLAVFGEASEQNSNGFFGGGTDQDDEDTLVSYAKQELARANVESDIAENLLAMIRVFSTYGDHSGESAAATISILNELLNFRPLTEITDDPADWVEVSDAEPLWQSRRRPTTFSRDGGKTWYDIEDSARNNGDIWMRYQPVQLGDIKIGEARVRVRSDAYEGDYADKHNNRTGLVVGVRNGLVTVKYDGDNPDVMGHQHNADKLEKYTETE